jgi:aspartate carbamoyltransferase catalytic subunit
MLSTKNVINIEDLKKEDIDLILENADSFYEILSRDLKKVPTLRGKTIINMFFESSTRTRTSFEIAAKRLSADLINFSALTSSLKKGESIIDTIKTIKSMVADLLIIRHSASGIMSFIAKNIDIPIINAGDGKHQHPTQSLLDLYTIKKSFSDIKGLKVAIVGDIVNSRVARPNIKLFKMMGMEVALVSAPMLLPENLDYFGVSTFSNIDDVIEKVDVIYMLRMQFERQEKKFYPSIKEYNKFLSLDLGRFKKLKQGAIVMHPGPVNRGVEISDDVMDIEDQHREKIKICNQVTNGLAIRMALIYLILS